MARNAEKARSTLNRWLELAKAEAGIPSGPQKRPYTANIVHNIDEAERWRRQILKDMSGKILQVQNEALDEYRIRDINDQINKLMREKYHWERRIRELGGADYTRVSARALDDGAIIGPGGYAYFGAARKLPGVAELLKAEAAVTQRKSRHDLNQVIDADYFGYRDEEDGLLIELEKKAEEKAVAEAVEEWKSAKRDEGVDPVTALKEIGLGPDGQPLTKRQKIHESYVAVPTREDMEKILLEKRKEEVLKRFGAK